jgi:hypothetical protein
MMLKNNITLQLLKEASAQHYQNIVHTWFIG